MYSDKLLNSLSQFGTKVCDPVLMIYVPTCFHFHWFPYSVLNTEQTSYISECIFLFMLLLLCR